MVTLHNLALEAYYVCATALIWFLTPGGEVSFFFDVLIVVLKVSSHWPEPFQFRIFLLLLH